MKNNLIKIKKALISVSSKKGLKKFVQGLNKFEVEIIASGGTANYIEQAGFQVNRIEKITRYPELLKGRVKTLHPKIHSAILADRDNLDHISDLKNIKIDTIDLVVCDLYPFSESVKKKKELNDCIENIDIGGITLLRGAAKNFRFVTVLADISYYENFIRHLKENDGYSTYNYRLKRANEAFSHSSKYDLEISNWFSNINKKVSKNLSLSNNEMKNDLSYGENSHQKAYFYQDEDVKINWGNFRQIQGKQLSYNNHLDLDASLNLLYNFKNYSDNLVGIIKHTNPCGVASGKNILEAFKNAFACDPLSAFGGIVVINKKVSQDIALEIVEKFFEMIIAPDFDKKSLKIFSKKKNLRIIYLGTKWMLNKINKEEVRSVLHGTLVQEKDTKAISEKDLKVVTKISPNKKQILDLIFAWNVVKLVKSNGIVIVENMVTLGIGSGQPSRVDSSKIAINKASKIKNSTKKTTQYLKNAVMASDAFFPFADGIDEAITKGVKSIIQPGGSINDHQVIDLANKRKISMVFTGIRSFKH